MDNRFLCKKFENDITPFISICPIFFAQSDLFENDSVYFMKAVSLLIISTIMFSLIKSTLSFSCE